MTCSLTHGLVLHHSDRPANPLFLNISRKFASSNWLYTLQYVTVIHCKENYSRSIEKQSIAPFPRCNIYGICIAVSGKRLSGYLDSVNINFAIDNDSKPPGAGCSIINRIFNTIPMTVILHQLQEQVCPNKHTPFDTLYNAQQRCVFTATCGASVETLAVQKHATPSAPRRGASLMLTEPECCPTQLSTIRHR